MEFDMEKVDSIINERYHMFAREYILADILYTIKMEIEKVRVTLNLFDTKVHNTEAIFKPIISVYKVDAYVSAVNWFLGNEENYRLFMDKNNLEKFEIGIISKNEEMLKLRILFSNKNIDTRDIRRFNVLEV